MQPPLPLKLVVALLAAVSAVRAQTPQAPAVQTTTTHAFDAGQFTLKLPPGFAVASQANPSSGYWRFAFTSAPDPDGLRGIIQVGIFDFQKAGVAFGSVDEFAAPLLTGWAVGRIGVSATESRTTLVGVPVKRIAWSGTDPGIFLDGKPVPMRGLMMLGIKQNFGFWLLTQERETRAAQALVVNERALFTFELTIKR